MEYDNWRQMPELSIALVALLHDCCNMSRPSGQESIFHRHGAKSVYLIEQMAGFGLTTEERNAIKHHMHKSKEKVALNVNHSPSRIEHTLNNPLWQMIRTCDICSALQPRSRYQLRTEVEQFVNNMD